jgi:hypothetical protein
MFRPPPNKKVGSRPLRLSTGLGFSSIVTRTCKSKLQREEPQLRYLQMNPVKRRFVSHPKDWPWSSFYFYPRKDTGSVCIDSMSRPTHENQVKKTAL